MRPRSPISTGFQFPAVTETKVQVISVSLEAVTVQTLLAKVICLIIAGRSVPVMTRVVPVRVKSVIRPTVSL